MAQNLQITIDGVVYDVRCKYGGIRRTFQIIEGSNSGTAVNGKKIRDILGTGFSFSLEIEPNPSNSADYDSLYAVLTSPVESHEVTFPYGQTTMTYNARVTSGTDTYYGKFGTSERWRGLSVNFEYLAPQVQPI